LKVGDLVKLKKSYKNRDRWAVITDVMGAYSFCKIVFMDTGAEVEAIKSGLIIYNELKDKKG
jgi:hypothetical protein